MTLVRRIIPCLDCDLSIPEGRVVKGIKFKQIQYAGNPVELAQRYYNEGADEIVFLDITASCEYRKIMIEVIKQTTREVFIPITVGGGIRSIEDIQSVLNAGADKITINTAALENPELITIASDNFGKQCIVVAIDAKKAINSWEVWIYGGRKNTKIDAISWAQKVEKLGAGEILLTSMDADGTKNGYDIELTKAVTESVNIPVIASGGVGNLNHIYQIFAETDASAALAASIFHYQQYSIREVKEFLLKKGIPIRTTF
jgi:cyclase